MHVKLLGNTPSGSVEWLCWVGQILNSNDASARVAPVLGLKCGTVDELGDRTKLLKGCAHPNIPSRYFIPC